MFKEPNLPLLGDLSDETLARVFGAKGLFFLLLFRNS
jgi:hypothetical protein